MAAQMPIHESILGIIVRRGPTKLAMPCGTASFGSN
jgi:hypothetical protein